MTTRTSSLMPPNTEPATARQLLQVLQLLEQQHPHHDKLQRLLESGLLADLFAIDDVSTVDRHQFRKVLGCPTCTILDDTYPISVDLVLPLISLINSCQLIITLSGDDGMVYTLDWLMDPRMLRVIAEREQNYLKTRGNIKFEQKIMRLAELPWPWPKNIEEAQQVLTADGYLPASFRELFEFSRQHPDVQRWRSITTASEDAIFGGDVPFFEKCLPKSVPMLSHRNEWLDKPERTLDDLRWERTSGFPTCWRPHLLVWDTNAQA